MAYVLSVNRISLLFRMKLPAPKPHSSRFAAQGFDDTQKLQEQERIEREYWYNVLKRVVVVVKTLAETGLPF